jgi:hypothetical protein
LGIDDFFNDIKDLAPHQWCFALAMIAMIDELKTRAPGGVVGGLARDFGVVRKEKPQTWGLKVDPREALEVCGLTHPSIIPVPKTLASPRVAPACGTPLSAAFNPLCACPIPNASRLASQAR